MKYTFSLQNKAISFDIPDNARIFKPEFQSSIEEIYTAVITRLMRPLGYKRSLFDLAKRCETACVVFDAFCPPDFTNKMLQPIVKTLHAAGMKHRDIVLLATSEFPSKYTGEKYPNELAAKYREYHVQIHHPIENREQILIGETPSGAPIYVDQRFYNADLKIITGGVHYHYPFGLAGAFLFMPFGLSNRDTIKGILGKDRCKDATDYLLTRETGQLSQEVESIMQMAKLSFVFCLLPDHAMNVIDIFSGKPHAVLQRLRTKFSASEEAPPPAEITIATVGCEHNGNSLVANLNALGIAKSYTQKGGVIIFLTSIFDLLNDEELNTLDDKAQLVHFFSQSCFIEEGDIYSRNFEDLSIIFVSPNLKTTTPWRKNRTIYFSPSIEQALEIIERAGRSLDNVLALPTAYQTPPSIDLK